MERVRQGHPPTALIWAAQRHIRVVDVQDQLARHQRRCMSRGTDPEIYGFKDRRLPANLSQSLGILSGGFQMGRFDGHGIELIGRQRSVIGQALA
jgi:hypothetical protein